MNNPDPKTERVFVELPVVRADPSLAGYPAESESGGALLAETPNGLGATTAFQWTEDSVKPERLLSVFQLFVFSLAVRSDL
jgi:hypothetical protein